MENAVWARTVHRPNHCGHCGDHDEEHQVRKRKQLHYWSTFQCGATPRSMEYPSAGRIFHWLSALLTCAELPQLTKCKFAYLRTFAIAFLRKCERSQVCEARSEERQSYLYMTFDGRYLFYVKFRMVSLFYAPISTWNKEPKAEIKKISAFGPWTK